MTHDRLVLEHPHDAVELVERCVLSVIDPVLVYSVGSYGYWTIDTASDKQNVATAQNINSPNSSQYASSTI